MRRRFTAIGLVLILTIISSVPVYSAPAPERILPRQSDSHHRRFFRRRRIRYLRAHVVALHG